MRILVVGGGGREHALIWKINQSPRVSKIFCAPGNGGIADIAECIDIKATDIDGIVKFAKDNSIDMTVVTPDDPLAMGMVDALENEGLRALGPRKNAAIIEGSKVFSKDLMRKYSIPTAGYRVYDDYNSATAYLNEIKFPAVIKADGLALGKGVIIAQDKAEAEGALKSIMIDRDFGDAGNRVVIEEYIQGPEVSVLTFTDGKTIIPMVSSQDHKRIFDNDEGPNTGGMGTFSPSQRYTDDVREIVEKDILLPTIEAMKSEGRIFKGILYFGIMLTKQGPKVLEYNARFGDPETQVVLPRLKTDIIDIFDAIIDERLADVKVEWEDNASVCVILSSGGYPKAYEKGFEISGLDYFKDRTDMMIFHAGTKRVDNTILTDGGRVLGITAIDRDLEAAIAKVYNHIDRIYFKDMHYRRDIGRK